MVSTIACHARGRRFAPRTENMILLGVQTWLSTVYVRDCESLCLSDETIFNIFDPKRHLPYWACARALSVRAALWACIYNIVTYEPNSGCKNLKKKKIQDWSSSSQVSTLSDTKSRWSLVSMPGEVNDPTQVVGVLSDVGLNLHFIVQTYHLARIKFRTIQDI